MFNIERGVFSTTPSPGVRYDSLGELNFTAGKAYSRNRVSQYFHNQQSPKVRAMVDNIAELTIHVPEMEALILECNHQEVHAEV